MSKKTKNKEERIMIRVTKKQKKFYQLGARMYTNGDLSKWVRYCLENISPKRLKRNQVK